MAAVLAVKNGDSGSETEEGQASRATTIGPRNRAADAAAYPFYP